MVKKGGGRTLNPVDQMRKQQRKKELKKNKELRQKNREASLLHKDTSKLKSKYEKYVKLNNEGKLDSQKISRLKQMEKQIKFIEEKEKEKKDSHKQDEQQNKEKTSEKTLADIEKENKSKYVNPELSIWYHPVLNPYGVPPPGKPMMYKTTMLGIPPNVPIPESLLKQVQQKEEEEKVNEEMEEDELDEDSDQSDEDVQAAILEYQKTLQKKKEESKFEHIDFDIDWDSIPIPTAETNEKEPHKEENKILPPHARIKGDLAGYFQPPEPQQPHPSKANPLPIPRPHPALHPHPHTHPPFIPPIPIHSHPHQTIPHTHPPFIPPIPLHSHPHQTMRFNIPPPPMPPQHSNTHIPPPPQHQQTTSDYNHSEDNTATMLVPTALRVKRPVTATQATQKTTSIPTPSIEQEKKQKKEKEEFELFMQDMKELGAV